MSVVSIHHMHLPHIIIQLNKAGVRLPDELADLLAVYVTLHDLMIEIEVAFSDSMPNFTADSIEHEERVLAPVGDAMRPMILHIMQIHGLQLKDII